MKIKTFEDFFKLQDHGSRMQLKECWELAQHLAKEEMREFARLNMTFYQLSEANRERQIDVPLFQGCMNWTPADWVTAICGELGEAANFIKKKKRGDQQVTIQDIVKELADVMIYTDILIQFYHYDTAAVIVSKFNEVSERVGSTVKLLPERTG